MNSRVSSVLQLTKKAESTEKEKNNAVCRYAAREAELMRLQVQLEQLEEQVESHLSSVLVIQ